MPITIYAREENIRRYKQMTTNVHDFIQKNNSNVNDACVFYKYSIRNYFHGVSYLKKYHVNIDTTDTINHTVTRKKTNHTVSPSIELVKQSKPQKGSGDTEKGKPHIFTDSKPSHSDVSYTHDYTNRSQRTKENSNDEGRLRKRNEMKRTMLNQIRNFENENTEFKKQ